VCCWVAGHPQHPYATWRQAIIPSIPTTGDTGVGTVGSQMGFVPTLPDPNPGVGKGMGAAGVSSGWGLQPAGHPPAPGTPVGWGGPRSRWGRRTISYLDNSTCPGSVSAGEWAARSFHLRVKAPGRLMAVKGAGRRETARGQQGGGWMPLLLHSHPSAHP